MELKKNKTAPSELGLMVGLEIHQQLATRGKLFCECKFVEQEKYESEFVRKLRPTKSELGEYDPAALFEFRRGNQIKYLRSSTGSCLVETDEEPPHNVNHEALDTALIIALALKSNVVDEIHVMRKIVLDGSNTSGFQRTMLVAMGGEIKVDNKKMEIQSISLEEDAAQLISKHDTMRTYRLDRLGTPLIEVAFEPTTGTSEEIMNVALALGRLMRASRRVSRGLGTIRQDVNISVDSGGVVEVKGVQKLDQLVGVIEYEIKRQHSMVLIAKKLAERKIKSDGIGDLSLDISSMFKNSRSKAIKRALDDNGIVQVIRLKAFGNILSFEPYPNIRLGKEFGELVRFYGLGGVFHSDELPAYGISDSDVEVIRQRLSLDERDAFVILAGKRANVEAAGHAIIDRAINALAGVPSETRAATHDGETKYSRPRAGSARMYPETDIPPLPITKEKLDLLKGLIPKPWNTIISELCTKYGLNKVLAKKIFDSEYIDTFEEIASDSKTQPTFIAATLTESLVRLEREGLDTDVITEDLIKNTFALVDKGNIAKESVILIFEKIIKKEAITLDDSIQKLGLKTINDESIEQILDQIVKENKQIISAKGIGAISLLMGKAMNILRGRVDGLKVNTLLREKIEKIVD